MRTDVLIALAICLACVGAGVVGIVLPQNSAYQSTQSSIATVQARIASDNNYISGFPKRLHDQHAKLALLTRMEILGGASDVERRFLMGLDGLVRRDHLGVRPLSLGATFAAATEVAAPTAPANPANAASASAATVSAPSPPPGSPPAASVPGPAPAAVSPTASLPGGAASAVPPRAIPRLFKDDGSLEIVGPWPSVLRAIHDLSRLPVLLRVRGATLTRESRATDPRNPEIDVRVDFSLYRVAPR